MRSASAFVIVFVIYAGSDVWSGLNKFQYLIVLVEQCKHWIEYFPVGKITAVETCTTVSKYVKIVGTVPQVVDGTAERTVSNVELSLKLVTSSGESKECDVCLTKIEWMMRNVISEVAGHVMIVRSSETVSWDESELSKYLEGGKSEFRVSREVADARRVELLKKGRFVKSKTPFDLFGILVLVMLVLLGLIHGWLFSVVKCEYYSIPRCRGLIKNLWTFSYKSRLDCM